jgi:hypothetical protein
MAGGHALLWSFKVEISVTLLPFLQIVVTFLFLGQASLATYKECVPSKLQYCLEFLLLTLYVDGLSFCQLVCHLVKVSLQDSE